jgi:hypothetical protein
MGVFVDRIVEILGQPRISLAFIKKRRPAVAGRVCFLFQDLAFQKNPEGGGRAICGSLARQRRLASTCPCCASSAELEAFFAANLTAAFGVLTLVS